jgi:soluble lytic murein transglycosylase-like protein
MKRFDPWMIWTGAALGAVAIGMTGYAVTALASSSWPAEGDSCSIDTYRQTLGTHVNDEVVQRAWRYMPLARYAASQFGLDPEVLAAIVHTESRWNPDAHNSVAAGFTQMIPGTAAAVFKDLAEANKWPFSAVTNNRDPGLAKIQAQGVADWVDRSDPRQSMWLGAALLRKLIDAGKGTDWAFAAYNAGAGGANGTWSSDVRQYVEATRERMGWYAQLLNACGGLFG